MRPNGVITSRKPSSGHHQETVGSQGMGRIHDARFAATASHVTHCRPVSVVRGRVAATWISWARRGVGSTTRVSWRIVGSLSSSSSTSEPSRGRS